MSYHRRISASGISLWKPSLCSAGLFIAIVAGYWVVASRVLERGSDAQNPLLVFTLVAIVGLFSAFVAALVVLVRAQMRGFAAWLQPILCAGLMAGALIALFRIQLVYVTSGG